jgi:hypothetical protein
MVLMMVGWEAGLYETWQKMLKGGLENNSRKPRDLVKTRHSDSLKKGQLTLSQGKMKKEDDAADDEDNDAVRTSVSPDQVTATMCTEELFLSNQYI